MDMKIVGNSKKFAVEISISRDRLSGVNFFYWMDGIRIGNGEVVDVFDIASSCLPMSYGVGNSSALFFCDREIAFEYLKSIPSAGGIPLSLGMIDEIERCNIWFHHCLGDFCISACAHEELARVLCAPIYNGAVGCDVIVSKEDIDDIFSTAIAILNKLADEAANTLES